MNPANAVAWFAQVALIVAGCAGLPRLVGLRSATLQHLFWRLVLAVCLALPIVQPRLPDAIVFVPAPAAATAVPATLAPPRAAALAAGGVEWVRLAAIAVVTGIALRLAWIATGLLRLRRLRRGAVEAAAGFDDLRQAIGVGRVAIAWSSDTPHPITFGAADPVVLLPVTLKSADATAQRAVVAHELHHVKRHDWLWTVAEEIVRAVFWFHPAMWWLISRVQLARETVVDELSIRSTNARRAYLDTLLAFADDAGLRSTPAFSARRHLFHRVMLLSKEGTMSSTRVAVASCLLAVALAASTWKAVSAFPLHGSAGPQQPGFAVVPDTKESYHIVATHYWEIVNKDASLTPEQKLDAIAKGIAAEDRAIAIDPNFVSALVYKNMFLRLQANLTADPATRDRLIAEADELRHTVIVMRGTATPAPASGGVMPPPPPPPPIPDSGSQMVFVPRSSQPPGAIADPVRVGGAVGVPMKTRDVKPVYPPLARQAGVNGVVVIEVLIDSAGNVAEAHILRSIPLLDQAALDAVRQWRFMPTMVDGQPRPLLMTTTVNFTLAQEP
jgi:TonB family protein